MLKWYLNNLDIFEYEKNEVVSQNLAKNDEDEIRELNKRITRLKIEERKPKR